MMSAKLLRLQTTDEAQAGFGAEQLKVVLNTFFKVRLVSPFVNRGKCGDNFPWQAIEMKSK